MIKTAEFYAGSRSFSKAAKIYGAETFCVDWNPYEGIDLVADVGGIGLFDLPYIPNVVWASPECTTYSVAGLRFHRKGIYPVSDYANRCDATNIKFLEFIRDLIALNPRLIYFLENPRGILRNMPFLLDFLKNTGGVRRTIWYCQYGDRIAKPTDIFTNCLSWTPRPPCRNGNPNCHHEKVGHNDGSRGVQSLPSGTLARSAVPKQLCFEVVEHLLENYDI